MSELGKANSDRPFFITLPVVGWIDVFTRNDYCEEFIRNLEYCRKNKGLKVYAYCIMSNHIHLIAAHYDGKLPAVIRDLKSYTAKRIIEMISDNLQESRKEWMLYMFRFFANNTSQNSQYQFWQKTSYPIELFTNEVFDQKVDYIHQNPVKAMLVNDETAYVYSSANPDSPFIVDEG
ncbi:transposase [Mucilaginibacter sp. AK015]|uniref:REP-associated tyrosine transposase n=1 Tax=Mucilaginibacter sp. AK015 TaxID=2723072 RepID=UPI00161221F9|nr:transposase [Mucilaginibacter sp. AK015]MBB5396212.1 REP element-mobilizing transposase RayT [Mucilaginibacter sp. AK015]